MQIKQDIPLGEGLVGFAALHNQPVVVADVLYYLSPMDTGVLEKVVARIADLLTPNGTCLLANHFFFSADPDSRVSRKIHKAFEACPRFAVTSEHRRAFFLATLFSERRLRLAA